jgi:hypothetical protein
MRPQVSPMYSLSNNPFEEFRDKKEVESSDKINRKVYMQESTWLELDKISEELNISRNELIRTITHFYLFEKDFKTIFATLDDILDKAEELQNSLNPSTPKEFRETARLLRGIRYDAKILREEILEVKQ